MTLLEIQGLRIEHREWRMAEENKTILAWISPLQFEQRQQEILVRREPGTGTWFIESASYKNWIDQCSNQPRGLWCFGKSMKTFMWVNKLRDC